jgi:hypothetical protein
MNIPLDRLYHYIENIAQEIYGDRIIIYRFWPHGSKNIDDLNTLHHWAWYESQIYLPIWCTDQEPLDYEFYDRRLHQYSSEFINLLKSLGEFFPPNNLNHNRSIFEKGLLLHKLLSAEMYLEFNFKNTVKSKKRIKFNGLNKMVKSL